MYKRQPIFRRQSKSSVPIGTNEPVLGSVREESQLGVTGPTSIVAGQPLSKGIDVAHVAPTYDTPTHASMSTGLMSATHAVCLSSEGAHVTSRPTLADDELASHQYTGQYAAVCTGLQVQTSAETLTAVTIIVGPLPYVAAFVTVKCAGVVESHRYSCTSD